MANLLCSAWCLPLNKTAQPLFLLYHVFVNTAPPSFLPQSASYGQYIQTIRTAHCVGSNAIQNPNGLVGQGCLIIFASSRYHLPQRHIELGFQSLIYVTGLASCAVVNVLFRGSQDDKAKRGSICHCFSQV